MSGSNILSAYNSKQTTKPFFRYHPVYFSPLFCEPGLQLSATSLPAGLAPAGDLEVARADMIVDEVYDIENKFVRIYAGEKNNPDKQVWPTESA